MNNDTPDWIKDKLAAHGDRIHDLELRLVKIETKMNIITFLAGAATLASFSILIGLITKLLGGG